MWVCVVGLCVFVCICSGLCGCVWVCVGLGILCMVCVSKTSLCLIVMHLCVLKKRVKAYHPSEKLLVHAPPSGFSAHLGYTFVEIKHSNE